MDCQLIVFTSTTGKWKWKAFSNELDKILFTRTEEFPTKAIAVKDAKFFESNLVDLTFFQDVMVEEKEEKEDEIDKTESQSLPESS